MRKISCFKISCFKISCFKISCFKILCLATVLVGMSGCGVSDGLYLWTSPLADRYPLISVSYRVTLNGGTRCPPALAGISLFANNSSHDISESMDLFCDQKDGNAPFEEVLNLPTGETKVSIVIVDAQPGPTEASEFIFYAYNEAGDVSAEAATDPSISTLPGDVQVDFDSNGEPFFGINLNDPRL